MAGKVIVSEKACLGTSQAVQWLGLRAFTAGGLGWILGQGTKIPHVPRCRQKKKKKKKAV